MTSTAAGASVRSSSGAMRPLPLTTTTGMAASAGSASITVRSSQPFITGIMRSSTMRQGWLTPWRSCASASLPLAASSTEKPLTRRIAVEIGANVLVILDDQHSTRHAPHPPKR